VHLEAQAEGLVEGRGEDGAVSTVLKGAHEAGGGEQEREDASGDGARSGVGADQRPGGAPRALGRLEDLLPAGADHLRVGRLASARAAFPGRVRGTEELVLGSAGAGAVRREDILLLDGGATPGPVPSTIVTLAGEHARAPRILRQGVLALADLERVAGVALFEGTAEATRGRTEAGA